MTTDDHITPMPKKGESGHAVVPDGRDAPRCWVKARCPVCKVSREIDAFRGPVSCKGGNPTLYHMFQPFWFEVWIRWPEPHALAFLVPEVLL